MNSDKQASGSIYSRCKNAYIYNFIASSFIGKLDSQKFKPYENSKEVMDKIRLARRTTHVNPTFNKLLEEDHVTALKNLASK